MIRRAAGSPPLYTGLLSSIMTARKPFLIDGIVPVIPTPFTADEQIDWPSFRVLIDFACAAGACAVCLPAYASEFYKLSEAERFELVSVAVKHADGRIAVIGQANFPSARQAAESAARLQELGASAVGMTVPRLFALGEGDIHRYFDRVLRAIEIPLIIQDFNPGGPSVSPDFVARLHRAHPHFRYIKLEEPAMGPKTQAILQLTNGEVGVIEGWGGMYILELVPAGVCGIMPGLALTDLLARVYRLVKTGQREEAYETFQGVLPQIVFSLQNMELFHHAEKRLLAARGILPAATVRDSSLSLNLHDAQHIEFLNGRILALLDRLKLERNPLH